MLPNNPRKDPIGNPIRPLVSAFVFGTGKLRAKRCLKASFGGGFSQEFESKLEETSRSRPRSNFISQFFLNSGTEDGLENFPTVGFGRGLGWVRLLTALFECGIGHPYPFDHALSFQYKHPDLQVRSIEKSEPVAFRASLALHSIEAGFCFDPTDRILPKWNLAERTVLVDSTTAYWVKEDLNRWGSIPSRSPNRRSLVIPLQWPSEFALAL